MLNAILSAAFGLTAAIVIAVGLIRWGAHWGSTQEERGRDYPGDRYLGECRGRRVVMTRAISIDAPLETVWPWLAQLGRGAGFYSYDRVDDGGKRSAEHLISWVPPPELGDAMPVGYLRHLEPGRAMVWSLDACRWIGATWRGAFEYRIEREGSGSRLLMRVSSEAAGPAARPALWLFQIVDSIMARRQLLGIKQRAEQFGTRQADPIHPETGARDQYQWYEAIFAAGEGAGVPGKEEARKWRESAIRDGALNKHYESSEREPRAVSS